MWAGGDRVGRSLCVSFGFQACHVDVVLFPGLFGRCRKDRKGTDGKLLRSPGKRVDPMLGTSGPPFQWAPTMPHLDTSTTLHLTCSHLDMEHLQVSQGYDTHISNFQMSKCNSLHFHTGRLPRKVGRETRVTIGMAWDRELATVYPPT